MPYSRTLRLHLASLALVAFVGGPLLGCSSSSNEPGVEAATFPAQPFATALSDSGKLSFELRSNPQPLEQGSNELLLTITETGTHEPASDLAMTIEPWMPHHDHGSSAVPEVSAIGDGQYLVRNLVFTMAGEWELRIDITSPEEDALRPTVTIP